MAYLELAVVEVKKLFHLNAAQSKKRSPLPGALALSHLSIETLHEYRDFTIAVDVDYNILTVKPDNLDPIDLPDARRQLPETLRQIRRLRESGFLCRCVYTIVELIGRQTYLDDFEDKLLTFMEQNYGIEN